MGKAYTWIGPDGNAWNLSSNWIDAPGTNDTGLAPSTGDAADFISFSGTVTGPVGCDILAIGPGSSLTLGGSGFFSHIQIGQDLEFDLGPASLTIGAGNVVSATILDIGTTLGGIGTLIADGTFTSSGAVSIGAPSIAGTVEVHSGGAFDYDSSNLTMQSGGLISVAASGQFLLGSSGGADGAFAINAGRVFSGVGTIAANVVDNGSLTTANFGNAPTILSITGDITGTGSVSAVQELDVGGAIGSGVTLSLFGNGGTNLGLLRLAQPLADAGTLATMSTNSTIALSGLTYDSAVWTPGSLTMTGASGTLTLATTGDQSFLSFVTQPDAISGTDVIVESAVPCFLPGTHIRTDRGEVSVEQLRVGDTIVTWSGLARPVVWIGHGRTLATRGRRSAATPVIVRKGALADNIPTQDLYITKGHALFLDGVLVPAEFLVNHRSIVWDDRTREVTVFHLELDAHDVLVANGAAAESYRDDGNRLLFQNANSGWDLPAKDPCAPVLTGGPVVDAIWLRLLERAGPRPGLPLTDDPDLHLIVDGQRVDGKLAAPGTHVFQLVRHPDRVRIVSRAAVPQELGFARDARPLGIGLRQIMVTQGSRLRAIDAEDPRLTEGFHSFEADNNIRWTDGDAAVPLEILAGFSGPLELTLRLGGQTRYVGDARVRQAA